MTNKLNCILVGLTLVSISAVADEKWDINKLDLSKLPPAAEQKGLTYAKDIRPLFEASCFRCHGQEKQKGGLRLDSLESVLKGGEDGKMVVPGDGKKSLIVASAAQINGEIAMPPKHKQGGPRKRPAGGPGGTNSPAGGPGGPEGQHGPGGPEGQRGPGDNRPPAKPLTPEQVGLVRAWIDQGAK